MPGEFVSDGKIWRPAQIVPRGMSPDRQGIIPGPALLGKDKDGNFNTIPDPAACEEIERLEGKGKEGIPVTPFVLDPLSKLANSMIEKQAGTDKSAEEIAALKATVDKLEKLVAKGLKDK